MKIPQPPLYFADVGDNRIPIAYCLLPIAYCLLPIAKYSKTKKARKCKPFLIYIS